MYIDGVSVMFSNIHWTTVVVRTGTMNMCLEVGVAEGIVYSYPILSQPNSVCFIDTATFLELSTKVEDRVTFIVRCNSNKLSSTKTKYGSVVSKIRYEHGISHQNGVAHLSGFDTHVASDVHNFLCQPL